MTEIPEHLLERSRERLELAVKTTSVPDDRDDAYWDHFERTSCKADWALEDRHSDEILNISVQEHYVGKAPNFRTLRYTFNVSLDEGDVDVCMKITPREMIRLGEAMLRGGLRILELD